MNYTRALTYAEEYLSELEAKFELVAEQYRTMERDVEASRIHVASLRRRRDETAAAKPAVSEDMSSKSVTYQIRELAVEILRDTPNQTMHRKALRKVIEERGVLIGGEHKDASVAARLGKDPLRRFKSLGKGRWQLIQPKAEDSDAPVPPYSENGRRPLVADQ